MDPKSLKYTPTHEWVHLEGDVATVGISRFAVDQLTDLIVIDLPKLGAKLVVGKSFGEIESVKAVSDIYSPVEGEVVATNSALTADVQLLGEDPYEKGWLVKVKISDPAPLSTLLSYDEYLERIAHEAH